MNSEEMDQELENYLEKKELSSHEKEKLIEKLLGTNDCGEKGIGIMIINKTFYVGRRHLNNNMNK